MAYNYNSVEYINDVDDKWVEDFLKRNITSIYQQLDNATRLGLLKEFNNLKEDAKFCHGDKVWVKDKLEFYMEKLHKIAGKNEQIKRDITGIGIVMFKKLSKMPWRTDEDVIIESCNESDIEDAVKNLDFTFTKSELDLLKDATLGGRRKRRRKRRKSKRKKRRKSRRKKRRKSKRKKKS